ncbi:MAG: hypothetical protein QXH20_00510 [Candidatus Bathyarchaeia archaeon]
MREFFEYAKRMYRRKEREFRERVLQTALGIAIAFGSTQIQQLIFPEPQGDIEELLKMGEKHGE